MTYTQGKLNSALKESRRGSVKDDLIRITARRCLRRGKDVCATSSRPFPSTASDDDSTAKPLTQLFIERPIERIAFLRRDSTTAQEENNRKRSGQRIGIDQNDCEPCNRSMRKKFVRALGDPASTKLQGSGSPWMRCSTDVQEVPNLSRVGPTRGGPARPLTTKQSPYAKHMRKAIGSPPAPDIKRGASHILLRRMLLSRAINSGPRTLCIPTLLGDSGG
ncbi:hypothetical protein ALC62_15140 [Cyphomyrmex costatus]|uniref:Uncharacterized protein n=1 Tax=Cyphomyrmex costatus TaxID=456900 RepID=A0A151I7U7_9HYME|nr:hypothetical protein ALC62_15140 [Cyphomyrmex costatus]